MKSTYETLEEFESLVSEELSELLSDSSKQKLLKDKKIDDNLDIYSELKSLFDENCKRDEDNFWNLGRASSLSFIDQAWKDHLAEMDYLRSGIGLRAMGQRDPLVEYQKEGYELFEDLVNNVKYSVIRILLNFDSNLIKQNIEEQKETNIDVDNKVGRNSPCPCGSGKKYKKCHG